MEQFQDVAQVTHVERVTRSGFPLWATRRRLFFGD